MLFLNLGMPLYSFQRWQRDFLNYVCTFARRGGHNRGPLTGLDRKGLWSSPAQAKLWFWRRGWRVFPLFKPWASWGVLRNVTTVVGVVVWEIQCCSYLACQEDLALHLTWPQGGLDASLMGFGCRIHTFPAAKINDECPRSWCQSLFGAPTAQ